MADGDPIIDMVQDPMFQKADFATQKQALAAHDPAFAQAGDGDIIRFIQAHGGNIAPPMPSFPPQGYKPTDAAYNKGARETPGFQMQESPLPGLVKGAASMLPVVGGLAGAVSGAPAFGLGGAVGAGLGAASGQAGNLAIQRGIFGEGPSTLGEQAKSVGIAGGLGAAAEVPGAIATSMGNRVLSRIAAAQPSTQFGNAAAGLQDAAPIAGKQQGILRGIAQRYNELSDQLGNILKGSKASQPIAPVIQNSRNILEDMATNPQNAKALQRVGQRSLARFDEIIESAKYNVGIKGNTATADQLASLQQELQKPAWLGNPGPVQETLRNVFRQTYGDVGQVVRSLAPESGDVLTRLSNLHAAEEAVKAYKPGSMAAISLTSALHPRTAAVLSPAVAGAAAAGLPSARQVIKGTAQEVIP